MGWTPSPRGELPGLHTRLPGIPAAVSWGHLRPPQARPSHAELSAFSSVTARCTVPESGVVCPRASPHAAPRPVRQRGPPLRPHRPQARLPSPPRSDLSDMRWPVLPVFLGEEEEGASLGGRPAGPPPFPDPAPHSRLPLPHTAAFIPFPDGASATPAEDPRSAAFRPGPIWWQRRFPQPPSPEASRPSVPRDTRRFPPKQ